MPAFCLLRLGAPHCGHAALVERMLVVARGRALVLVGSADVADRPDVPLPWEERRDLLIALLHARGVDTKRVTFAPLAELKTDGWDTRWCGYLLDAARGAFDAEPSLYVFGDDYDTSAFATLVAVAPLLILLRVPRRYEKSARELRAAIATGDATLRAKYEDELAVYSPETCARIARVCAAGVDRPQGGGSPSPASP